VGFRSRIAYKVNSLVMFGTRISVRSCSPSGLGLGKNLPPKQGIGMERFSPKWGQVWGAILYRKILRCRTYVGAHDVYDQGVQALWGSGSSAFVEQMQRIDRSKLFILDRVVKMGRNVQHCSKYNSRQCSKLL
jgi:hypothetical protein